MMTRIIGSLATVAIVAMTVGMWAAAEWNLPYTPAGWAGFIAVHALALVCILVVLDLTFSKD